MNTVTKKLFAAILIVCFVAGLMSCNLSESATNPQKENKDWLGSVERVIPGYHLSLQDDMTWGMSVEDVKSVIVGPYENDYETYISKWIPSALPASGDWEDDRGDINEKAFVEAEMLSYYAFGETGNLIEYGYQQFSPTLEQYDFLKAYYTKKYGEPKEEEYIWRDESYKPTGKEDLYAMFKAGQVKVMTAWDMEALGAVLVVDWLNDPVKLQNNFGQISFYMRTGELTLNKDRSD